MIIEGKAWVVGDHVNTDDIIPARYLNTTDKKELAVHCLENTRPGLVSIIKPGDILVAGENFGCGSSREHAPIAIKQAGFAAVIACSFARIFFRNAINIGLPVIETNQASQICEGDCLQIYLQKGLIIDVTQNRSFHWPGYPAFLQELITAGGLIEWVKRKYIKSE